MLTINKLEPLFQDFPTPALILAATETLEIVKVNDAYLHLLNRPQDEICGQQLFNVFPDQEEDNPESVVKVTQRTIREVISTKEPQTSGAIAYYLPDPGQAGQRLRFFMPEFMPVIDESGSVAYIFHFTQEVKGELAIKGASNPAHALPYESFIETSQNPYFLSKLNGQVVGINQAACDLFGYTREEFKTVLRSDVLDYNDHRLHVLVTERERTGKARGEVTGIKRTGERFACEYSSVTFKDLNGEKRCCTEIIDLSKWKQAEAKAHQSEENLRAIFNSTVDGFVLVNRDLQVMAYNDKARDFIFLNSDLQAVPIGSSIFEYVDKSRHAFFGEVTKRVLSGETIEYERSYERRTEEPQWFTFSLNPVNEAGKITGLCISARNITVQKRAEEGRINSEKRFRGLVEHNSDAIAILSVEGRVLYVSPAAEHINGFSEEEAREMNVFETIHEDDRPKAMQVMQKVMEQPGIPINAAPLRMRHKNGTWRWIEAVITNMLHDPAIGGIIDNFRDVTERMESEEKYRKIFNLSPLPKWIYDLDTLRILEVNEEAVRHYGYSHEEFLTITILDVRPSEDSGFVKEVLKDLTNSGAKQFGYWRHLKKNGEIIMVDITGHPIEYNGRNARMVICRDVTVKLKAQTELIRSNERFHQAARATSDAIWDWDMITETVFLGEGYATLFGYPEGGHTVPRDWIQQRIHPDDREHVKQKVDEVIIEKISDRWQDEYQFQKADGSWAIVCNRGVLITDENGKPLRMVGAMNDVTAQKAEEHHLRLLESVITNTTDAVMITAAKSAEQRNPEVIYINPAMESMTGYSAAELKATGISIINGPETDLAEMHKLAEAIKRGESCQILTVFYKKGQQPYWASLVVSPVTDGTGLVRNHIAIARDVTERMEYIRAIEEQNRQLREIAWFQSHIVRAPLSRLMGLTDLAIADKTDESFPEILRMLRQSADELDAIVREIVRKTQIIYGDLADGDN